MVRGALGALNAVVVLLALGLSAGASLRPFWELAAAESLLPTLTSQSSGVEMVDTPKGQGVRDAAGIVVLSRRYTRIVGGSLVADRLLLELAEPAQVLAALDSSRATAWGYRIAAPQTLSDPTSPERLLAIQPDLVVLSDVGQAIKIQRLRELGLSVFVLGPMRGRALLLPQIRALAALLQVPERGEALVSAFERRSVAVAHSIPFEKRRSALYVSSYGEKLFGGTTGTSYSDVLEMAGLRDVARGKFEGWPQYSPEHILGMDPDVIVTTPDSAKNLCGQGGLEKLRACNSPGSLVAVSEGLLGDPGLAMLDAAEGLFAAVYGSRGSAHRPR